MATYPHKPLTAGQQQPGQQQSTAGLVDALAAQMRMQQGQNWLERGAQTMATPKRVGPFGAKRSTRNQLIGALERHWGRKDMQKAAEMARSAQQAQTRQAAESALLEEWEADAERDAQARAAAESVLANGGSIAQADAAYKATASGLDAKKLDPYMPKEPKARSTKTIQREVNGREHTILVDAENGEDIRDLGPTSAIEEKEDKSPFSSGEMEKARKQNRGLDTALELIADFDNYIEGQGVSVFPGTIERTEGQAKAAALLASLKDAFDLGALQGPDLELLEPLIPDLSSGFRASRHRASLAELRKDLLRRQARLAEEYGPNVLNPPQEGEVAGEPAAGGTTVIRFDAQGNPIE